MKADLATLLKLHGLPTPTAEYQFAPPRKWRFDWAWPELGVMLAVECEGGAWVGGRHTRPQGFAKDIEKYNCAVLLGWRLLRFTPDMIQSGKAVETIKRALARVGGEK